MDKAEKAWQEYYDYRHKVFGGPGNGCDDYRDIPNDEAKKLDELYHKAKKLEK